MTQHRAQSTTSPSSTSSSTSETGSVASKNTNVNISPKSTDPSNNTVKVTSYNNVKESPDQPATYSTNIIIVNSNRTNGNSSAQQNSSLDQKEPNEKLESQEKIYQNFMVQTNLKNSPRVNASNQPLFAQNNRSGSKENLADMNLPSVQDRILKFQQISRGKNLQNTQKNAIGDNSSASPKGQKVESPRVVKIFNQNENKAAESPGINTAVINLEHPNNNMANGISYAFQKSLNGLQESMSPVSSVKFNKSGK